ncbi:MAG: PEP-CTERM sorting domain-containing protein [Candidatus Brocadiaceae bacterium]|nr:PEP-CTERM sorting domain-containing protein [Candidatus Brocadiaceae bacterium]
MKNLKKLILIAVFSASLLCLGSMQQVNAIPILKISDGVDTVVVEDGSGLDNVAGTDGVVGYVGSIGGFNFNNFIGFTKPIYGTEVEPRMHLNTVVSSFESFNGSGGLTNDTITIMFTETDFTASGPNLNIHTLFGGVAANNIELSLYLDENNTEFGMSTLVDTSGILGAGSFSDTLLEGITIDPLSSYSLTLVAEITHTGIGSEVTSFDLEMYAAPEPSTILLMGIGFVGLAGGAARRKWKKKSVVDEK